MLEKVEPSRGEVRSNRLSIWLFSSIAITMGLAIVYPFLGSRHLFSTVIIYDEAWSRAAGIDGMGCTAPEFRNACQKEAAEDEAIFLGQLSKAFSKVSECNDLQFFVDSTGDKIASDERLVAAAKRGDYWRLRADFRPRLPYQYLNLSLHQVQKVGSSAGVGGNNAEDIMSRVCYLTKHNGIDYYW